MNRDELVAKIASLEGKSGNNTANIAELMRLKGQLAVTDAKSLPELQAKTNADIQAAAKAVAPSLVNPKPPVQGAASLAETQAAGPYGKIAESGFFAGPTDKRPAQGAATLAETLAAKPYEQIGSSGHYAGPNPPIADVSAPGLSAQIPAKDTIAKAGMKENPAEAIAEKAPEYPLVEGKPFDWGGLAKKLGVGALELINAFALGKAGVTDPSQLASGQRLAREGEATKLAAAQAQADKELAAQAKKDELDRAYQAEQQAIQNQFTIDRDAKSAQDAAAAADAKYQHDLGLIRAELTADKQKTVKASGSIAQALAELQAQKLSGTAKSAAGGK
jgi:hypothetical protein